MRKVYNEFSKDIFFSPAWGEMCITGGGAIAQPPDSTPHSLKPRRGEIIKYGSFSGCDFFRSPETHLALAGLCCLGLLIRRLRCATPPVLHISPHAGLKNCFARLCGFLNLFIGKFL
jgi:hypothetical protein